jgi:sugar lactone lactonase YvrE
MSSPSELKSVVARRGIRAVQLTYENRVQVCDLVGGRLHQHGRIDKASASLMSFTFEIELPNGHMMRERQWLLVTEEGIVSVLDDDTFRLWFEIASDLELEQGPLLVLE